MPGGRVVRVTPAGVVTDRTPSGVMVNRHWGAWVLSRWWGRHRQHRFAQSVGPPSACATTWSRPERAAGRRQPGCRQVLSRARTNRCLRRGRGVAVDWGWPVQHRTGTPRRQSRVAGAAVADHPASSERVTVARSAPITGSTSETSRPPPAGACSPPGHTDLWMAAAVLERRRHSDLARGGHQSRGGNRSHAAPPLSRGAGREPSSLNGPGRVP